jgi:hypothetical protein
VGSTVTFAVGWAAGFFFPETRRDLGSVIVAGR